MAQAGHHGRGVILDGVQYLRGLAALLVVIGHENGFILAPKYLDSYLMPSLEEASGFAVAVFFVISGFIIVVTSLDARGAPRMGRAEFLRRRAVRILPFLWLCTIAYNVMSWLGTGAFDWAATLRTLMLSPLGDLKPNVAWSLRHEVLFYVLFALTMLGMRQRWLVLALWIAIGPVLFVLVYDLGLISARHETQPFDAFSVVFMGSRTGAHLQFGVGIVLGLLYQRAPWPRRTSATVMLFTLLAAAAITVVLPLDLGLARLLTWTLAAGGIVALATVARPWPGLCGRIGMLLGNASFSIYLTHNFVMLVLIAAVQRLAIPLVGKPVLAAFLFVAVLLSLLVGIAVHALVERPLIRAIDRRTRPALPLRPVPLIPDGA